MREELEACAQDKENVELASLGNTHSDLRIVQGGANKKHSIDTGDQLSATAHTAHVEPRQGFSSSKVPRITCSGGGARKTDASFPDFNELKSAQTESRLPQQSMRASSVWRDMCTPEKFNRPLSRYRASKFVSTGIQTDAPRPTCDASVETTENVPIFLKKTSTRSTSVQVSLIGTCESECCIMILQ